MVDRSRCNTNKIDKNQEVVHGSKKKHMMVDIGYLWYCRQPVSDMSTKQITVKDEMLDSCLCTEKTRTEKFIVYSDVHC
jgi:hypothetical protein